MKLTDRFSCLLLLFAAAGGPALATDCNENGREDDLEISSGESPDCNRNGVPDDCDLGPVNLGLARRAAVDIPYWFDVARPADLDGDADLDLAASRSYGIDVLVRTGAGEFERFSYSLEFEIPDLTATDLDGDGDTDLGAANELRPRLYLLFNDGRGAFSSRTILDAVAAVSLVPIDLNRDGLPDLATADSESKSISLFLNQSGGSFSAPVHLPLAEVPRLVLAGDLDEDGNEDLVAAAATGAWLLSSDGGGQLSPPRKLEVDYNQGGGLAVDLDSDGRPDLVFTEGTAARVLRNRGDGTFEPRHHRFTGGFQAEGGLQSLSAGDLDGDRKPELVLTGRGPTNYGALTLLRNLGEGNFAPGAILFDSGSRPALAVIEDFGSGPEVLVSPFRLDQAAILSPTPIPLSRDCNSNAIPDDCDLAAGTSSDCNSDRIPDECLRPGCGEPVSSRFRLGFENPPLVLHGAPGEIKTVEVFATLTSEISGFDDGPQGWSISMFIKGARLTDITLKGVHVSTIFDHDADPETAPLDPFDLELKDAAFKVATKARTLEGFEGAATAVVLQHSQTMVLHPNGTERIARLTLEGVIPEDRVCAGMQVLFRDGVRGTGQPVNNMITFRGAGVKPQVDDLIVLLCPAQPFLRCDPNDDGISDLADAIWLFGELFIPEGAPVTACPRSADCNGDGAEDISDPIHALAFQFLDGPAPPTPFPACGALEPGALPCPFDSTGCWP